MEAFALATTVKLTRALWILPSPSPPPASVEAEAEPPFPGFCWVFSSPR